MDGRCGGRKGKMEGAKKERGDDEGKFVFTG